MSNRITVERLNKRFEIPEEDLEKYVEGAQWLIERDVEAGHSREEAERIYGIRIVQPTLTETE